MYECIKNVFISPSIGTFRDMCIYNNEIICSDDFLLNCAENNVLKMYWWSFTKEERILIGKKLINIVQMSYANDGHIKKVCSGDSTDPNYGSCYGCINQELASIGANSIIRQLTFNGLNPSNSGKNCYYWNEIKNEWVCYYNSKSFGLPCFNVRVSASEYSFPIYNLCALRVDEDIYNFNNWIFFQHNYDDIKPGDSLMPYNNYVSVDMDMVLCSMLTICQCQLIYQYKIIIWYV